MQDYDPERVAQVACPTCDAQPGERCKSKSGRLRNRHDFHATRKAAVYPRFGSKRGGLSDPSRKAKDVLRKLDAYLDARDQLRVNDYVKGWDKVAEAREDLFAALKEVFTHGS